MLETILHFLFDGGILGALLVMLMLSLKHSREHGSLKTAIDTLMTNDLPHIRKDIRELREAFVTHLEKKQ